MPVTVNCDCGEPIRVAESDAGKLIRCPVCSKLVAVPPVETPAIPKRTRETPPNEDQRRLKTRPLRDSSQYDGLTVDDVQIRSPRDEEDEEQEAERRVHRLPRSRVSEDSDEVPRERKFVPPLGIIAGSLLMMGAVLWFALGIAVGLIYFQPVILFLAGVAAFIAGLASWHH